MHKVRRITGFYHRGESEIMKTMINGHEIFIDEDEAWRLEEYHYRIMQGANRKYYVLRMGLVDGKWLAILLHREINNTPKSFDTDHINGNSLDNRKINLRTCTRSQNSMNKGIRADNASRITGVSWDKRDHKWRAYINFDGRQISLGFFNSVWDAKTARQLAELELFGEFAYGTGRIV
jgi:hypothetical protein